CAHARRRPDRAHRGLCPHAPQLDRARKRHQDKHRGLAEAAGAQDQGAALAAVAMSAAGLTGRRALITGASRGIGRATALALASAGVRVVINYARADAEAATTAEAVSAHGVAVEVVQADVADAQAVAKMFEHVKQRWGGIDILVNNAAMTHDAVLM